MSNPPHHSKEDPCPNAPSAERSPSRGSEGEATERRARSALRRTHGQGDDEPLLSLDEALRLHHEAIHANQPSVLLPGAMRSNGLPPIDPLAPSSGRDPSQGRGNERGVRLSSTRRDRDGSRLSEGVTAAEILDEACRVADEVDVALRRTRRQQGRSSPDNAANPSRPAPRRRQPPGDQ
jgi:hypothetical protein